MTTDAIYEERGSDWSHQVSAVVTTWWLTAWSDPSSLCEGCGLQEWNYVLSTHESFDHICAPSPPSPLPPPSPSLDSTQNRYTICGDIFMCMWLMSPSIVCGYSSLWCLGHSTSFASFYLVRIVYKLSLSRSGFVSSCVCCLAPGQSGYTKLLTLHTQLCCKLWCNLGRPKYEARVHKNRRSD